MWQAWRHHVIAAAVLAGIGVASIIGMKDPMPGVLGTRGFGYGALVLLIRQAYTDYAVLPRVDIR